MTDRIDIAESRRILKEARTVASITECADLSSWDITDQEGGWIANFPYRVEARAHLHAINTLPLALDEIERLRAEVERLRESIKGLARVCDGEPVKARRSLDFWAGVDYGNRNTASALRACLTPDRAALTPEDSDER